MELAALPADNILISRSKAADGVCVKLFSTIIDLCSFWPYDFMGWSDLMTDSSYMHTNTKIPKREIGFSEKS